ncbi:MAG: hypothetical protein WDW38_004958 [Sanguina aurantia]
MLGISSLTWMAMKWFMEKVPFLVLTIRYEQLDILILRRVLDKTVQAHFDIIEQHGNAMSRRLLEQSTAASEAAAELRNRHLDNKAAGAARQAAGTSRQQQQQQQRHQNGGHSRLAQATGGRGPAPPLQRTS